MAKTATLTTRPGSDSDFPLQFKITITDGTNTDVFVSELPHSIDVSDATVVQNYLEDFSENKVAECNAKEAAEFTTSDVADLTSIEGTVIYTES